MSFDFKASEDHSEDGRYCPSCGRYVGHHEICPYCGARVKVRVKLKALAMIALFLAFSGVIAVYFAANAEPPTITVSQITPEMNYARVKIIGYAISAPSYDEMSGYFTFRMMDINGTYNSYLNTSVIVVNVYSPLSNELVKAGKIPVPGDMIIVAGTLKVRNYISLTVNYFEDLQIIRREPIPLAFDEVASNWSSYLGQPVRIRGWVVDYRNSSSMILFNVRDYYANTTFELQVYLPEIIYKWTGNLTNFSLGDYVDIVGNLWSYRGSPELVPWNATSISIIEKLNITPLDQIISNSDFYGNKEVIVMVNATVVSYNSNYHNIIKITDNSTSSSVTLFIDWDVWDALSSDQKALLNTVGYNFLVIGVCMFYKGSLEISVYDTSWILFS